MFLKLDEKLELRGNFSCVLGFFHTCTSLSDNLGTKRGELYVFAPGGGVRTGGERRVAAAAARGFRDDRRRRHRTAGPVRHDGRRAHGPRRYRSAPN